MFEQDAVLSRRTLLAAGGAGAVILLMREVFRDRVFGVDPDAPVEFSALPRQVIGKLSELQQGTSVDVEYPMAGPAYSFMLVKLGERAGGGIGPDQDVVAFSKLCTHQGADMSGGYRPAHAACVCPLHLTSFDLTKHGMVIAGHATTALPQAVLELDGDDIVATGIAGLLYGHHGPPVAQRRED